MNKLKPGAQVEIFDSSFAVAISSWHGKISSTVFKEYCKKYTYTVIGIDLELPSKRHYNNTILQNNETNEIVFIMDNQLKEIVKKKEKKFCSYCGKKLNEEDPIDLNTEVIESYINTFKRDNTLDHIKTWMNMTNEANVMIPRTDTYYKSLNLSHVIKHTVYTCLTKDQITDFDFRSINNILDKNNIKDKILRNNVVPIYVSDIVYMYCLYNTKYIVDRI